MQNLELLHRLARLVAEVAHDGQTRHGGAPYIGHPRRVSRAVQDLGYRAQIVALLHDVIEDTGLHYSTIRDLFGGEVMDDVGALTRTPGESYGEYMDYLVEHGSNTALRVKLADLRDNLSDDPRKGLVTRYETSIERVETELARRSAVGRLVVDLPDGPENASNDADLVATNA